MLFDRTAYIGIVPAAPGYPLTYAALDNQGDLLALSQGNLAEVLAFTGGQRAAVVAIAGPQGPARRLFSRPEVRQQLEIPPRPGRWEHRGRVAEYLLRRHNLRHPLTPADEDACPNWMRTAFRLFQELTRLGFARYPTETPRQVLETYPHAVFAALLEHLPFPKDSLEGRIQRQLVLREHGLPLPDPMRVFEEITRHRILKGVLPTEGLYTPHELDALAAAFTAQRAHQAPDQVLRLGHPEEGEVVVPVPHLLERYH